MKNTIIKSILDVLAPNYCSSCGRVGSILCGRCKKDKLVLNPRIEEGVWFLGERKGLLKELIHRFKFEGERESGDVLAELLAEFLPDLSQNTVIVPLPTIDKHVRMRGLDHTKYLAMVLARVRGWRVEEILERKTDSVQVGASEKKRIEQARRAYKINKDLKIDPSIPYLLLDDVWTTGSSLLSAREALKEVGAKKIDLVVLAKS